VRLDELEEPVVVGDNRELVARERRRVDDGVFGDRNGTRLGNAVDLVDNTGNGGDGDDSASNGRSQGGDLDKNAANHSNDLCRGRQLGVNTGRAVKHVLEFEHLCGRHRGGIDDDLCGGLESGHLERRGGNFPAESQSFRRVVDGRVRLFRRSREATVDKVQLVSEVGAVNVITDAGTVGQAEDLPGLLTDCDAGGRLSGTVALGELFRVGEGFDGCTKVFCRNEVEVLDVVRVLGACFSARGRLGNRHKAVPCEPGVVHSEVGGNVEDSVIDAGLIDPLASLVPNKFGHVLLLKSKCCKRRG